MRELRILSRRLMTLDDRIVACMKCGLCQAVCPMFGASMMEADVARGKLALVGNLAREMFDDPEAVAEKLGRCLLCGSCEAACPSGVKIMDVFLEARELVHEYLGLSPIKKAIFRGIQAHPRLFNALMRVGSPAQSLLFRKSGGAENTVCSPLLAFMLGKRHVRSLPLTPLHARYGTLNEPRRAGGLKVAFYPGCMGDKMYVDMAEACLKVLRRHGVAVYMPANFACCGIPALASGDAAGMKAQLAVNLKLLEGHAFDYLITPCGTCASTIKKYWPRYAQRLGCAEQGAAEDIARRTMDISAFLVDVVGVRAVQPAPGAVPVTYHDSCHLKKALGVAAQPRELIAANPGCVLTEMKEADRCCGCGGSFNLFHYDWSSAIGQRKRDNIAASGARVVAAGCPACMMQLEDVLSRNHDKVRVKHPVELYAETLGEEAPAGVADAESRCS